MPQGRQTGVVNKEALNALTDLYYLFSKIVWQVHHNRELPEECDIYFLRPGGLKELLEKYYVMASVDPAEAGSPTEPLMLEHLFPFKTISQVTEESWKQITDVCGKFKEYNNSQHGYGTPTPQEVREVLQKGQEILDRQEKGVAYVQSENLKPKVTITTAGIGVPGIAGRHYVLRGGRKKAVLEMLEKYPETLSAKAWARLVGKQNPASSDSIQQVSSDVKDINKRFKINLQLDEDLILNRNGYVLNFDELDIKKSD